MPKHWASIGFLSTGLSPGNGKFPDCYGAITPSRTRPNNPPSMNKPLNQVPTKQLPKYPDHATMSELYDAGTSGCIVTFAYQRNGKRVYVTILEGERDCRGFLDNVNAYCADRSLLTQVVRKEVRRALKGEINRPAK